MEYLDPVDETPEEALNRRLRWAKVNQWDPANRSTARFLIENEADLREVLKRDNDAGFLPLDLEEKASLESLPLGHVSGRPQIDLACVECDSPLRGRVAYLNSQGWRCRDCALGYD